MAEYNLSKETIDESIGNLVKCINSDVMESCDELAAILMPERGKNEITDQVIAGCKTMQTVYNEYITSAQTAIDTAKGVAEIAEYLEKRADMGTVASASVDFKSEAVDPASVVV